MSYRSLVLLSLFVGLGCGQPGIDVKLIPVTGSVSKDGKALSGIKVMLETKDPALKAPMLYGVTDAEGKYEIQTSAGEKGAPAGLYKVYLASTEAPAQFDYANPGKSGPKKDNDLIPVNYQSPNTTELSVEVGGASATYDITIK